jgi:hypothetical protein
MMLNNGNEFDVYEHRFPAGTSRDDVEREIGPDHMDDLATRVIGRPVRLLSRFVQFDFTGPCNTFTYQAHKWEYADGAELTHAP